MSNHEAGPGAHAVLTNGVTKRYGRATALDGIDLRVPEGAVYVLVGANGAGKSTTFNILMNLQRPSNGTAEVLGLDTGLRGAESRAQIGFVPEHSGRGLGWMTCEQLIRLVAAYYPTWDWTYADELSRAFDLPMRQTVRTLSKGAGRRLQLLLALAHRPPLLLLDEPTEGLDPLIRNRTLSLLAQHLADSPTTVLMATHHVQEMESLADYVGVLRKGKLVAQLSRDDLRRTVRRYRASVPEGWSAPAELRAADMRRSSAGRDVQLTMVGDERELTERLTASGAAVHEVTSLALEDAALVFLSDEAAR